MLENLASAGWRAFSSNTYGDVYTSQIRNTCNSSKGKRCDTMAWRCCSHVWLCRLPILFLAVTLSLPAGEFESWTDVDATILEGDRLTWGVAGVARFRDTLGSLYDRRATTVAEVSLNDRWGAVLGYMALNRKQPALGFDWDHRATTGLTYAIVKRSVAVGGTTLYERHFNRAGVADFNRYRQQFDIERPEDRVSPWMHQSLAFENRGFVRSRSRFGLRWLIGSGHSFKAGYQFESIRFQEAWRPRHAVYTAWSFDVVHRAQGLSGHPGLTEP